MIDRAGAQIRREKHVASQVATVHRSRKKTAAGTNYMKAKKARVGTAKQARRRYRMKARHGMTPKQYEVMHKAQGGRCAICGKKSKRLCVDHDHKTGVLRGLLCNKCNSLLGFGRDSVEILEAAIRYLLEAK